MKSNNKFFSKAIKMVAERALVQEANSTSCIIYYQPKAPSSLKKFSKLNNDK